MGEQFAESSSIPRGTYFDTKEILDKKTQYIARPFDLGFGPKIFIADLGQKQRHLLYERLNSRYGDMLSQKEISEIYNIIGDRITIGTLKDQLWNAKFKIFDQKNTNRLLEKMNYPTLTGGVSYNSSFA